MALTQPIASTFLDTQLPLFADLPNKVADLSGDAVRFGRKELELALHEMPPNVRRKVLGEMTRVLKKKGRILIIDFHPGARKSIKGWLGKAVIYFFEITAGPEHYKNFRHFIAHDGIPGLIEDQNLAIEQAKIVGGGNLGLYVLSISEAA